MFRVKYRELSRYLKELRHAVRSVLSRHILMSIVILTMFSAVLQFSLILYFAKTTILQSEQLIHWRLARTIVRGLGTTMDVDATSSATKIKLATIRHDYPEVDIYLIDQNGFIVNTPPGQPTPILKRVSAMPLIEAIRNDEFREEMTNDDPLSSVDQTHFSVARFGTSHYLYLVLHGRTFTPLFGTFGVYSSLAATAAFITVLGSTVIVGGLIFAALYRRINTIGESAANLAHDLKSPIASTQSHLDTLLLHADRLGPDTRRDYLQTSLKNMKSLAKLTEDLMQLWRYESNAAVKRAEMISLVDLASDVLAKFAPLATEHGVLLELEASAGMHSVLGDMVMLERVVTNLVDNAIRHSPHGGRVSIDIRERLWRKSILSVRDEGMGLPPGEAAVLFERFYRKHVDADGHCGLGLAICSKIVKAHNGVIWARSEAGKGTSFHVALPRMRTRGTGRSRSLLARYMRTHTKMAWDVILHGNR